MSDGKLLKGVQYDPLKRVSLPYTERVHDYSGTGDDTRTTGQEAVAGLDQTPIDLKAAKVRAYDLTAIQAAFEAIVFSYPFRIKQLQLPLELVNAYTVLNQSSGAGRDSHPSSQQMFTFTSGSGGFNPRGSAEGSAAVSYDLVLEWRQLPQSNLSAMAYGFHLGDSSITESQIRTRLEAADLVGETVNPWPVFKEAIETIVLNGQQASVRAAADTDARVNNSAAGIPTGSFASFGSSYSIQVGINQVVRQLPACIHGNITLVSDQSATATANAEASTLEITNTITGTVIPAITNTPPAVTKEVVASCTPNYLLATSPATVPSSGKYLLDYNLDDVGFGVYRVTTIVLDASIFA